MPALIDRIEPAVRKRKTWEISDWTSFSLMHTNKHTETMKKRRRYGVIKIDRISFQCVCIYTKSHGWESELQFHIKPKGAISTSRKGSIQGCVTVAFPKMTRVESVWKCPWNAPIQRCLCGFLPVMMLRLQRVTVNNSAWTIIHTQILTN